MTNILPDNIHNSYLEYKTDTKIYVNWLVSTSVHCGFTPPYTSSGAARPKARSKKPEQREITTKGLLACAEAIVKKPPKQFEVPLYAAKSAARAIRQRTKISSWYENQAQHLDEADQDAFSESNDAHNFFTNTLKRTLELLRPFISKAKESGDRRKNAEPASIESITNRFSKLEIEELADQDLDDAVGETAPKPSAAPRITYVVDQGKEDLWAAIQFLFEDFSRIKMIVITTWYHFTTKKDMDLVTAAATSPAAMQMLRNLVHDFTSSFPQITSMDDLYLEFLRCPPIKQSIRTAESDPMHVPRFAYLQLPEAVLNISCMFTYERVWHILNLFADITKFWDRHRWLDPLVESGQLKGHPVALPRLQSFINALDDIASTLRKPALKSATPPVLDNFTELWLNYFKDQIRAYDAAEGVSPPNTGPILSIELLLCTDLYLKVQSILSCLEDPMFISKCYGYHRIRDSDENMWKAVLRQPKARSQLNSFFRSEVETQHVNNWLTTDEFWIRNATIKRELAGAKYSTVDDVNFGRVVLDWTNMNPFLAGMISFIVAQAKSELRVVYQNINGLTLAYAHLYNCLRHCRSHETLRPLLEQDWLDMETFLTVVGDTAIFKGERPKSLLTCGNRLKLSHGLPLQSLAPNVRRNVGRGSS